MSSSNNVINNAGVLTLSVSISILVILVLLCNYQLPLKLPPSVFEGIHRIVSANTNLAVDHDGKIATLTIPPPPVTRIVAGSGITITPTTGEGEVTIEVITAPLPPPDSTKATIGGDPQTGVTPFNIGTTAAALPAIASAVQLINNGTSVFTGALSGITLGTNDRRLTVKGGPKLDFAVESTSPDPITFTTGTHGDSVLQYSDSKTTDADAIAAKIEAIPNAIPTMRCITRASNQIVIDDTVCGPFVNPTTLLDASIGNTLQDTINTIKQLTAYASIFATSSTPAMIFTGPSIHEVVLPSAVFDTFNSSTDQNLTPYSVSDSSHVRWKLDTSNSVAIDAIFTLVVTASTAGPCNLKFTFHVDTMGVPPSSKGSTSTTVQVGTNLSKINVACKFLQHGWLAGQTGKFYIRNESSGDCGIGIESVQTTARVVPYTIV